MYVGTGRFLTNLECPRCGSGTSLESLAPTDSELAKTDIPAFLRRPWHCSSCKNDCSIADALVQGLFTNNALAGSRSGDLSFSATTTIDVGLPHYVDLPLKVPYVLSVNLTPYHKYALLGWMPISQNRFCILSSVSRDPHMPCHCAEFGEKMEVAWMLSGRSPNVPVWQSLLIEAREDMDRGRHSLSIFSSCTGLEAFVDWMIVDS